MMKTHNPPWPYMFTSERATCLFCLQTDCPVLARRTEFDGSARVGPVTPGSVTPGSVTPGSVTPGSVTPGSVTPGSVTPGSVTLTDLKSDESPQARSWRLMQHLSQSSDTDPRVGPVRVSDPALGSVRVTDPGVTDSRVTDPGVTDPGVTDPRVTDPRVTGPRVTGPGVTGPVLGSVTLTDPKSDEAVVVGICEACVLHAHWVWRTSPGEAPPAISEDAVRKVARVKVVLVRRRPMRLGSQAATATSEPQQVQRAAIQEQDAREDSSLVNSYDFAMIAQDEGDVDFPGCDLVDGESDAEAVKKALEKIRVYTWPPFIEPLYKAYTPRGRLVSVVLVTAWAMIGGDFKESNWREWPPHRWVAPGMKGFYAGFEQAWSLRMHKRQSASQSTEEISVFVHEAAARYITLQQQLRSGEKPQDLSMIEYLRKSMTDDEKRVDATLRKIAEAAMDLKVQLSEGRVEDPLRPEGLRPEGRACGPLRPEGRACGPLRPGPVTPEGRRLGSKTSEGAAGAEDGRGSSRGQVASLPAEGSSGGDDDNAADETEEMMGSQEGASSESADSSDELEDTDDESESDDLGDDNDWPEDLSIQPGDRIVDAEFEELPSKGSATQSLQPGFVRTGRPLDTSKKS